MRPAIQTIDLARRFRRVDAVTGLNLTVPAGSIVALLGPNGAGKTTTIKLLMNLLRPSHGRAVVLGTDSRRLGPDGLARIGYVSENQRLPDWLTPRELLEYVRPFYPTWDEPLRAALQTELGLADEAPLGSLSRGTRMKAALLASLAFRPELIVLDEPFTGLDPLVRDQLVRALLALPSEQPCTILVSSHDVEEVERLADRIAFMDRGRLIFHEAVDALLTRFRQIDVVTAGDAPQRPPARPDWLVQGFSGRTLRLIDTRHDAPGALDRLRAAFPLSEIRVTPLSLREIFVALARAAGSGSVLERAS
jgi:ABC-2 type transport system ATP-binding protein